MGPGSDDRVAEGVSKYHKREEEQIQEHRQRVNRVLLPVLVGVLVLAFLGCLALLWLRLK